MTSAAKHFGKDLYMFWLNTSTGEYLLALSETLNTGKSQDWSQDRRPREERLAAARATLAEASRGGNHMGTWAHPKLAVFFARWLDVRFSVWCDSVIDELLRGKAAVVPTRPAPTPAPVDDHRKACLGSSQPGAKKAPPAATETTGGDREALIGNCEGKGWQKRRPPHTTTV